MSHTVAPRYVEQLLAGALSLGYSRQALLAGFDYRAGQRMAVEDYVLLLRQVWSITRDESAGYAERPLKPGSFAMLCHACLGAANLRKALLRAGKFFALLCDDLQLELTEDNREASLRIHQRAPRGLDNLFYVETLFLIMVRWASWMIDKKLLIARLDFASPAPEDVEEAAEVFGLQPHYQQPVNRLVFASRFLDDRIAQTEKSLKPFLSQAPISLLSHYRRDTSLSAEVRRRLQQAVDAEARSDMSLEQVAGQLHLTSQTLRRRLREEGNSFQEIKDAVRCALAIHFLMHEQLPAQDIADKMGFSEASVFYKAFKRWTGLSPGAYKEAR